MHLDEFQKYSGQYEKGISKITFRSSRPRIQKQSLDFTLEKSFGNYELFFNRKGLLLHSVHTERTRKSKVIYGYTHKGLLVSAMSLASETNELLSLSEFSYDNKGRIEKETVCAFYFGLAKGKITREYHHRYSGNQEEISIMEEEDDEYIITYHYDGGQNVIEEKAIRNGNELILWHLYSYDVNGKIVKEISLDENGRQDSIKEFHHFDEGARTGYIEMSDGVQIRRESITTVNEQGHWIEEIILEDGEPSWICERSIEYY